MIEAIAVGILALLGAFLLGSKRERDKKIVKDAKDYQKTMERMHEDDAIVNADYAREWVRNRKP